MIVPEYEVFLKINFLKKIKITYFKIFFYKNQIAITLATFSFLYLLS